MDRREGPRASCVQRLQKIVRLTTSSLLGLISGMTRLLLCVCFGSEYVGGRAVTAIRRLRGERPHRAEACASLDGHGSVVSKGGVAPPLVVSLSTTERWQKTPPHARKTRGPGPARGPTRGLPRFGYAGPPCQARQRAELLVPVRKFMDRKSDERL